MMSTMTLQEKLGKDFDTHKIVVDKLYSYVQKNGVLKIEFTQQMEEVKAVLKRLEKTMHNKISRTQKIRIRIRMKDGKRRLWWWPIRLVG